MSDFKSFEELQESCKNCTPPPYFMAYRYYPGGCAAGADCLRSAGAGEGYRRGYRGGG